MSSLASKWEYVGLASELGKAVFLTNPPTSSKECLIWVFPIAASHSACATAMNLDWCRVIRFSSRRASSAIALSVPPLLTSELMSIWPAQASGRSHKAGVMGGERLAYVFVVFAQDER
jgi:hypothetical protein